MDGLALSVEGPVWLSPASRKKLETAQKKLRQDIEDGRGTSSEAEEVIERAYEDASQSVR